MADYLCSIKGCRHEQDDTMIVRAGRGKGRKQYAIRVCRDHKDASEQVINNSIEYDENLEQKIPESRPELADA